MDNSRYNATHSRATSTPTWTPTPARHHHVPAQPREQSSSAHTNGHGDHFGSNQYASPLNYVDYAPHLRFQISYGMQVPDPTHSASESSTGPHRAQAIANDGHHSLSAGRDFVHFPQHPQHFDHHDYASASSQAHTPFTFTDSRDRTTPNATSASHTRQNTLYPPQQSVRAASMSMDKQYFCQHVECKAFHTGFTTKGARTRHIRDKHSGIPLRCQFCHKLFADSPSVGRHEKKCAPAPGI